MSEKILLIDGHSIVHRAFYGIPPLINSSGVPTNAVYGFLTIMFKFIEEEKPDYITVAFDLPAPTFRHEKFEEYKGTRKPMDNDLRCQIPILKNLLEKMNIVYIEKEGFEADDVLGTLANLAEKKDFDVTLVSGDRDMLQLATKKIKIKIPKTKNGKTEVEEYDEKEVFEKYGVTPTEFIDVKALMGDVSDNIPGVPGIGEKTAIKLIKEYKNIENAIDDAENVKPKRASENLITYKEQAILSKELATIIKDVPIDFIYTEVNNENIFNKDAFIEIQNLEFKSMFPLFDGIVKEKNVNYNIIENINEVDFLIDKLLKEDLVSYAIIVIENEIAGISFSHLNDRGTFILFDSISKELFLKKLKRFFESNIKKIALNSKFDKVFLHKHDIEVNNIIFDSMLAAYVINSSKDSYDYEEIGLDFLNEHYPSEESIFGKGKSKKTVYEVEKDELVKFAGRKADVIFRAYKTMNDIIKNNNQEELYYEIELPLVETLKDMEIFGIKVNRKELLKYQEHLGKMVGTLTEEIYTLSGEVFNINSPKQLGEVLFEKMGMIGGKKTKTGFSTAHDVLIKIIHQHPIIEKILEYRTIAKLKSTYADGLLNVIAEDDKIYSTFNQLITTTGRISSTEPNLQNIPIKMEIGRELRKVFIPSKENYVFLDSDYSQIELRVLASISGDETLINAFKNGEDIHKLTASQVFNIPFDEVTSKQRSNAKAVNFGIVYGISAFSLSEDLSITRKEADKYIEGYFAKYPKVKIYLDESIEKATALGYAETTFNRRRNIPELASSNFNVKGFGKRVAMNMPIQGTAADIIKIAMIKVRNRIIKEKLNARLILQVHDELLLEVDRNEIDIVKNIVKEEMEQAVKIKTPLEVELQVGENWYETK